MEQEEEIQVWLRETYEKLGCPELFEKTTFTWDKSKRKLGSALYRHLDGTGWIKLSELLWVNLPRFERKDTVVHEACHIVDAYFARTRKGWIRDGKHGKSWAKLMGMCGYAPKATYNAKESQRLAQTAVPTSCQCVKDRIIPKHIRLMIAAGRPIVCNHCQKPIKVG